MSTGDDPRPLRFAVVGLDHSHAFGQTTGLLGQGCELVGLSSDDPDAAVARAARGRWPDAPWVADSSELLHDPTIDVIVTAAVPDRRGPIAVEALRDGKDVVADKPGCVRSTRHCESSPERTRPARCECADLTRHTVA